ncbi:caspase family protein [Dongia sp.]|uniref:caspase family protein n=1 Tax=Dongia sp. TaxID=1977262 RepID=UPI0035B06D33
MRTSIFGRYSKLLGLAVALVILAGGHALAEPRVALVIGNAGYGADIGNLANPVNDAKLMQASLGKAGFDVILVTDADQKEMKRAIIDFGDKLAAAGPTVTALFYYSGHGIQVGGENYLIPLDAQIERDADVDLEAISADTVLKQMQFSDARVNIVILDACRNNPLPRSFRSAQTGLARIDAPRGSFVAYSTAPGDVAADGKGDNSPYTAALATAITTPGLSIEEAFRNVRGSVLSETGNAQTPWESSSLTAPFFFTPKAEAATADAAPAAPAGDARALELAFWDSVKASKDPADFVAYLEQYPNGNFARLARNRLNMLTGNVASTAPAKEVGVAEVTSDETPPAASSETANQLAGAAAPTDPDEAAKACRNEDATPEAHLAACQAALKKDELDRVAKGDLTNEVGRAYYDMQQYDQAIAAYGEAMKLDPAEPAYVSNLGLALSDSGDYAGSVTAYDKAINLDPKNVWHYYNRGYAKLYQDDPAGAAADLDAALAIDENFDLLSTRGYVALAEGNDKQAVEYTNRALASDPNGYNISSIAVLYLAGRTKDMIAMADRQIEENGDYGYGQIWKAMALQREGQSGAARSLLTKTINDHREDWPGILMKWMVGKFDDETLLAKAREGTDQDARNQLCEANFYLGEHYFSQGDKEKAAAYLAAALETKVHNYIEYYSAAALQRQLGAN